MYIFETNLKRQTDFVLTWARYWLWYWDWSRDNCKKGNLLDIVQKASLCWTFAISVSQSQIWSGTKKKVNICFLHIDLNKSSFLHWNYRFLSMFCWSFSIKCDCFADFILCDRINIATRKLIPRYKIYPKSTKNIICVQLQRRLSLSEPVRLPETPDTSVTVLSVVQWHNNAVLPPSTCNCPQKIFKKLNNDLHHQSVNYNRLVPSTPHLTQ